MSAATGARAVALASLRRASHEGAYVRDVVPQEAASAGLDARDAAFTTRLALGATAARGTLDTALDMHLDNPEKLDLDVRLAMRLAAFEVLFLSTPDIAAVSQGVELARSCSPHAAGVANAVLRRVACNRDSFLSAIDAAESKRFFVSAARRAGLPTWLYRRIEASIGEDAMRAFSEASLEPAPVWAHLAPSCEEGVAECVPALSSAEKTALPGCVRVRDARSLAAHGESDGHAVVSDFAAQAIARASVRPGSCLEVGAGRGTKTFVMSCQRARGLGGAIEASAGDTAPAAHIAVDQSARKCALNLERLRAGGFSGVDCVAADGRSLLASETLLSGGGTLAVRCAQGFDTVLLDAPCSGTGTMRRHPEIPWRLAPADVDPSNPDGLPALQLSLLREAARAVAPGGELLYATCSVLRAEDEDVVRRFLASPEGEGFSVGRFSGAVAFAADACAGLREWLAGQETEEGFFRTCPKMGGCDGHFCARLVRAR